MQLKVKGIIAFKKGSLLKNNWEFSSGEKYIIYALKRNICKKEQFKIVKRFDSKHSTSQLTKVQKFIRCFSSHIHCRPNDICSLGQFSGK